MEMVKTNINSVDPETKKLNSYDFESEAVAIVAVTGKDKKVEISQAVVGTMNGATTHAMVKALVELCREILKEIDPRLAARILASELERAFEGDEE